MVASFLLILSVLAIISLIVLKKSGTTKFYSIYEVSEILKMQPEAVMGIMRSGLLGYSVDRKISKSSLENFLNYGTQWVQERRTLNDNFIDDMRMPNESDNMQPFGCLYDVQLNVESHEFREGHKIVDQDDHWIAQVYFKPNYYFFPNSSESTLIGPTRLKLNRKVKVDGITLPTYLYPDPDGYLAMIMIFGNTPPSNETNSIIHDISYKIIDQLIFEYNQPLPIAHTVTIQLPSGVIGFSFARNPSTEFIPSDEMFTITDLPEELKPALSLYREGVCANNPFYQFLCFWKVTEYMQVIKGNWRRDNIGKTYDTVYEEKFLTDDPTLIGYKGLSFQQAIEKMNKPYRVAIAHADAKNQNFKITSIHEEYRQVQLVVPVIRHISFILITNLRHNMDK